MTFQSHGCQKDVSEKKTSSFGPTMVGVFSQESGKFMIQHDSTIPIGSMYGISTYIFSVKNGHMNKGKWRKVNIPFVLWIRKWDCKTVEFLWDCKTHSIHGEYHLPSTLKINHVTIP